MAGSDAQTGAGTRFGKFLLLKKLASGGMGEIFLAKQTGLVGFEKILVIKRILQHHLNNKQYVDMFFSEARIAAMLSHSNVIQVYDMGEVDEHFYIAMEYVHGRSLKEVIARSNHNNNPIPLAYVADIISQACAGLSYSHNLNDAAGQPLNVIHRDINPHNLLLSYHGELKIIDFGIAKSTMQVSKTEAGTIKGKFIYMSPEQSAAEPLDKRSDVFSVSIVLYELIAGFNPFQRDNIVLSLEAIQRRDPRLVTEVRPEASAFLPILKKGLAKDRRDRYADCADMRDDLQRLLQESIIDRPPRPIGEWLEELFADRIEEDRQILLETGSGIVQAGATGLPTSESTEAISVSSQGAAAGASSSEPTAGLEPAVAEEAIRDVFADSTPSSPDADALARVLDTSQPDAKVLEEFDSGFADEKTRRLVTVPEPPTRHDRPAMAPVSEATSAFAPPIADREETKEYSPPPTTAKDIEAMAAALEALPPRRRTAPLVAGAVALVGLIILVIVLVGRGGDGEEAGPDAALLAVVAGVDAALVPRDVDAAEGQPVPALDSGASAPPPQLDAAPVTPAVDAAPAVPAIADAGLPRLRPDAASRPDRTPTRTARVDAGDEEDDPGGRKPPPPRRAFGTLIVNPGPGNTVSLSGRAGSGRGQYTLRKDRGSFVVAGGKLRVTVDFRVVGDGLKLEVDSKPWAILSDGGISRGRTPQKLGTQKRFSLEFRSPKLSEPVKIIVIFKPPG